MKEIIITPNRSEDLPVGTLVDDSGDRFVVMGFSETGDKPISVTMNLALFEAYVGHLQNVLSQTRKPAHWRNHK